MLLCLDIGNTNITFGLYEGKSLAASWRVRTIHDRMPDEYGILMDRLFHHRGYRPRQVTGIAIASVVPPLTPVFEQVCRDYVGREPLVVGKSARVHLVRGDVARLVTATGGGWGDPLERPVDEVLDDLRGGYITPDMAQRDYGVTVDPATLDVVALREGRRGGMGTAGTPTTPQQ